MYQGQSHHSTPSLIFLEELLEEFYLEVSASVSTPLLMDLLPNSLQLASLPPSPMYREKNSASNDIQNWKYVGGNTAFSFPSTGVPAAVAGAMELSFVQDSNNQFYLQIVNGNPSGGSGSLDIELMYTYNGVADPSKY